MTQQPKISDVDEILQCCGQNWGNKLSFQDAVNARTDLIAEVGNDNAYLVTAVGLFIDDPDLDALASAGLTEGTNDKKIDLIFHDKETKRLVFAQGYMAKKNNDSAPANKASDLNTACAWLLSGDISTVPPKLKQIIADFREAISENEIDYIDLLYVHNLPESVNVSRELQTVEEHLRNTLSNDKILVKSYEFGEHKLNALFAAQDSHIEVMDEITFPGVIGIKQNGKNWSAGVGTVSGDWIHLLFTKYGDKLYSANYRGFLGADRRKRVNSGIRDSAEKNPTDFWAFNNGITVLTLGMKTKSGREGGGTVLKGISVINGAQTTGSIGSVDVSKAKLGDVKLLCRIIECSDQDTIDNIVKYNNTQNLITTWDQFSNDPDQKRISAEFTDLGFSYNRKRGFIGTGNQIGIEMVLQPLLAFHGRPTDAVRGKNQLFVQKHLYQNAFDGKKARHILFVYTLAKAIDSRRIKLKEKSDAGTLIAIEETQLKLLRNLNFKPFLISSIANSLEAVTGFKCDQITVGFKPDSAKNATIVDLAARWLPVVETILPLLTPIVSADTFFKSLSSDDHFIKNVKLHLDAMLTASGAQERLKTFSSMVAGS